MFVDYLEGFLKKNKIKPNKLHARYITFFGKNCNIRIWFDGRVHVYRDDKMVDNFKFNEKQILSYMR